VTRARPATAGFTLLEVLVSLAILAGALAAVFQVFSRTLDTTADAESRTIAASLAQSLLARVGSEIPLEAGESSGELDGGFRWRLRTTPYDPDRFGELPFARPYEIAIDVLWNVRSSVQRVHLSTLRLATARPAR
jgi:general secretion pathway protein I